MFKIFEGYDSNRKDEYGVVKQQIFHTMNVLSIRSIFLKFKLNRIKVSIKPATEKTKRKKKEKKKAVIAFTYPLLNLVFIKESIFINKVKQQATKGISESHSEISNQEHTKRTQGVIQAHP